MKEQAEGLWTAQPELPHRQGVGALSGHWAPSTQRTPGLTSWSYTSGLRPSPQFPSRNHFLKAAREAGQRPKQDTSDGTDPAGQMGSSAPPGTEPGPPQNREDSGSPCCSCWTSSTQGTPDGSPQPTSPFSSPGPGDRGENNPNGALSLCCVFYLIFQRTHSFIIQNRESKLRRNGFLSIRLSAALSNCL